MSGRGRRARLLLDATGCALIAAAAVLATIADRHGGNAGPFIATMFAVTAAFALGRVVGLVHRALVPAAVVVIIATVALTTGSVVGGDPLAGSFGYRNATGAFFVQGVVAALIVSSAVRWWPVRALGIAAAVPLAVVAVQVSVAATVSLLVVPIALLALGGVRKVRLSILVACALFVVVLAGTVVLGAAYRPGGEGVLAGALTVRRLELWHESLGIIADHPGGVGPGRFAEVSSLALGDVDAHWAHQEFLQQGVELGWAGLAISVLLFLWGFARLWAHPAPDLVVAFGAASLAALGIHASVDYVLHFLAVPLAAAALVGSAQAVPIRRFQRGRDEHRSEGVEDGAHAVGVARSPKAG